MKILMNEIDWVEMKIGEQAKMKASDNVTIIKVPYGWIYNEYTYCEKLGTMLNTNTFIPCH